MKTDQSVYIQPTTINPWLSLAVILLAPLITVIDVFIVNISTPAIKAYFHSSDAALELVIASYLLGYAVFLITGSRAGDYLGKKKVFIIGLAAFTITSALCGFSNSMEMLIISRFLQGISAAFTVPQTITLIQLNFQTPEDRDKAYGLYGMALGTGATLGQFLGGYFVTSHLIADSWRLIFLVNLPVGLIAITLAYFFVQESQQNKSTRFDVPGIILLTLALTLLIYPIIQGTELGWPAWTIGMLIAAILLLIIFVWYQKKLRDQQRDPLVPLDLFRIKSFNTGIISVLFFFGVNTAYIFAVSIFFQNGFHMSPFTAGNYFVMQTIPFLLASLWSIKNAACYGNRLLQVAIALQMTSFIMQLILFRGTELSPYAILPALILYGTGSGIVMPSLLKVAMWDVPPAKAGAASGVYSTIQQFASALGVSMLGGVFLYLARTTGNFYMAYKVALFCMMGYLLVVMVTLNRNKR
ncbi:EmrB/QacA subfamily drug resistance transporter [Chitinophaga niastensis]|uniref:EmrB/QacA subfamily drug resistance transporter n=1 Tax=Chitinophaga niastensis TaxID=536980 RepID=A0A2P8HK73_CHINA|nr:MFS transporter [Chitinophaga niastensis]PSL46613.1 EmrB/QacA subfamily drug resistance transporter [Chitinophaga niastensis]